MSVKKSNPIYLPLNKLLASELLQSTDPIAANQLRHEYFNKLADLQNQRMMGFFADYGINPNDPNCWQRLCFQLAELHPDFRIIPKERPAKRGRPPKEPRSRLPPGRPKKWDEAFYAGLAAAVTYEKSNARKNLPRVPKDSEIANSMMKRLAKELGSKASAADVKWLQHKISDARKKYPEIPR